jgi:transcriptional regulator with XRE-family HTH domain
MVISNVLKELRKAKGLSLRNAAEKVDTSFTHLAALENGKVANPRIQLISALANLYGCSIDYILGQNIASDYDIEPDTLLKRILKLGPADRHTLLVVLERIEALTANR